MEAEIAPRAGQTGEKIDIPAAQAVPVQPGRSGVRDVSGHRRWVTCYLGPLPGNPGTLQRLNDSRFIMQRMIASSGTGSRTDNRVMRTF